MQTHLCDPPQEVGVTWVRMGPPGKVLMAEKLRLQMKAAKRLKERAHLKSGRWE